MLALLKHANVLETCGTEGQPVQLSLNSAIGSFVALRSAHDAYLTVFCSPNGKIPLSSGNWEEVSLLNDVCMILMFGFLDHLDCGYEKSLNEEQVCISSRGDEQIHHAPRGVL